MKEAPASLKLDTVCFHCGEQVLKPKYIIEDKSFCCKGCQTVYEIINKSDLCSYYDLEKNPGINQRKETRKGKFQLLADESVAAKLIHFKEGDENHVNFYLPQMHCSSCIWLLEHLHKIDPGVKRSTVNFLKKEITIQYNAKETDLSRIAESLSIVGYEPHISLNDTNKKAAKRGDRKAVVKIGLAGFCFGNIMMLSFPEYFSMGIYEDKNFRFWFNYLNLLLSLPVLLYSASEFFTSAYKSLRQKFLNIDAPIALAIAITFLRSVYEIVTDTGSGYLDSMSGIVFFMLIGRFFQNRTYQSISFDRDFTSYFPLGVTLINEDRSEKQIAVTDLKVGNRIKVYNDEIIPADAILFMGKGLIDYSFVSGEAKPVGKGIGEIIYAGGKQTAGAIELEVVKEVSKSYLTQLWNNEAFKKGEDEVERESFVHLVSRYFTYALFSVAITSGIYWQINDPSKTWTAVTAVLIVACPCALLLCSSFTNGNMIQILNKYKLYVKNNLTIERLGKITSVVFDKTGTITKQDIHEVEYFGEELNADERQMVRSLASHSNHPLSRAVVHYLPGGQQLFINDFEEIKGKGLRGLIGINKVLIGSNAFVNNEKNDSQKSARVYVSIDGVCKGYFEIKTSYREGLNEVIEQLKKEHKLYVLSGDNDAERERLKQIFGEEVEMRFDQKPEDKLNFIQSLQLKNERVIMFGDGLNDAGALKQSDVGIAISDNTNNFSPACDAIMEGRKFYMLPEIIRYAKQERTIIYICFIVSILYNIVGLSFSVQGTLKPVIAAILMPISSVSIVLLTIGLSNFYSLRMRRMSDKSQ